MFPSHDHIKLVKLNSYSWILKKSSVVGLYAPTLKEIFSILAWYCASTSKETLTKYPSSIKPLIY